MPSTQLPRAQAPQEPATDLQAPCSRSLHVVTNGHRAGFEAPVHPEVADREAGAQSRADRRRGSAAVRATARWLRRALADSARAWALAAGVPPDLYH
jgi:hypothetical protein